MSSGENLAKVDNYYPLDYNAIREMYENEPVNGREAKRFVKYEERERLIHSMYFQMVSFRTCLQ